MKRSYLIDFINKYFGAGEVLPETAVFGAAAHLDVLKDWAGTFNLVGTAEGDAAAESLYLDSLVVAKTLSMLEPRPAEVHDVGSGAGFPGLFLPLVFGPSTWFFLHESRRKRASFLKTAARAMGMKNVSVSNERVKAGAFQADLVTSRATFPPSEWLSLAATLARPGGRVVLLKSGAGAPHGPEVPPGLALDQVFDYRLAVSGRERAIVVYVSRATR